MNKEGSIIINSHIGKGDNINLRILNKMSFKERNIMNIVKEEDLCKVGEIEDLGELEDKINIDFLL